MKGFLKLLTVLMRYSPWFDYGALSRLKALVYAAYFEIPGDVVVHHGCVISHHHRSPGSGLSVGTRCEFAANTTIDISDHVSIGNGVTVSEGAKIYTHDHKVTYRSVAWRDQDLAFSPLNIGDDVWIGANAIVLEKVTRIGTGAIVGAGAVVTADIGDYAVVAGVPAVVVGRREG